jgi:multiple sugar transport system permease protein
LPLLAPTLAVAFILRLILAFKVFDEVYLLTGGGPGTATEMISYTVYRRFFAEDRAGYGAAMAVATFVLVAVLVGAAVAAGRRRTL